MRNGLIWFFIAGMWSVAGFSQETWIFHHGNDLVRCEVGQGNVRYVVGLMKITATGKDLTLTLRKEKMPTFRAEEGRFFAIRYRISGNGTQGGLFFTHEEWKTLSDKSYSPFPVVADGQWHDQIVDMAAFPHQNWKGNIHQIRLDPVNPSVPGTVVQISRLGFFPTREAGEEFLKKADDTPDFTQDSELDAPAQRVFIPGGTLREDFREADFLLENTEYEGRPEENVVVFFDGEKEEIVAESEVNRCGFVRFVARRPGKYALKNRPQTFSDVEGHPQEKAIRFVASRGLMNPVEKGIFAPDRKDSPEETLTRAQKAEKIMHEIQETLGCRIHSPFPPEYFTRERLRIGAWGNFSPRYFNEEAIQALADCGFDWLLAMSSISSIPLREDLLRYADQHGVEVYLHDGAIRNHSILAEYCEHPSFGGHYLYDEPGTTQFEDLGKIASTYREKTGKVPFVNLLPMYANAAQFRFGASAAAIEYYDSDPEIFRKYCEEFCRKFDVHYICTDIYPLNWSQGRKTTYKDYAESIHVIARVAREQGRDFWCFIQTFGWTPSKRTPNEAEFRWQCYTLLSFGCKGILCWTYGTGNPEFPSLVDEKNQKTKAWYDARTVFQELRKLSDVYMQYRNLGAFAHRGENVPYLRISQPYTQFEVLEAIDCEEPLLCGCFEKKEGTGKALTLVNMTELQDEKEISVRLKLRGQKVVAWFGGVAQELTADADGFYPLTLKTGEGVFLTVE